MINLLEEPEIIYKDLLDKGEDLTIKEVIYLHLRGVSAGRIRKVTNLTKRQLTEILKNEDSVIKNHKKAVDKMGAITKFNMTKEKAEQLKAEGKNKTEIAKISGVSLATYIHHEKKWNGKEEKKIPTVANANEEYNSLLEQLKEQVKQKDGTIEKLHKKIDQLEQEKMDLHAAANDTEKEAAAAVEYLERESELMIDADVWKQQALQYKAENERLNSTLADVRQDADKYKGDSVLFRSVLKAVL